MSQILPILPYPNPFLRERAAPVNTFDDALTALVENMKATMHSEEGLGLAATQVGVGIRLLLLSQQAFKGEAGKGLPDLVVINPEIVWQSDDTELASEGCLSSGGLHPCGKTLEGEDRGIGCRGEDLSFGRRRSRCSRHTARDRPP